MVYAADKPAEADLLWKENTILWLISSNEHSILVIIKHVKFLSTHFFNNEYGGLFQYVLGHALRISYMTWTHDHAYSS